LVDIVDTNKIIRLSKSCIGDAEKQAVLGVLDREHLGMGVEVQQFEDALSEFFGRQTVCVINGTAALHLSLQACGVGPGDEVLVPSLTYVASFQAISATGALPVACDINEETYLLDLVDAEKRITKNTKAIMPVHYTGGVGDLNVIYEFANKYNLKVIEDAAHAFGTTFNNKRVGSFGDIVCFSFDGIKNITSGEGGCIVTDDETILEKVRDARLLGVEKDTNKRYADERSWNFETTTQGWRYHMSNIMAAIGIEQLKRFPLYAKKRQQLAIQYDQLFTDHSSIQPLPRDYKTVVPHIYVVRIFGMKNRKEIQQKMLEKGVQVGYHYQPNHWLSYFKNDKALPLSVTESVFPEIMSLPLHPDLSNNDVEYVVDELSKLVK
jgi:dTDP-4-amino-4,6-dideoxygalactose transaminase